VIYLNWAFKAGVILSIVSLSIAGCQTWDMPAYGDPVILGADGSSGRIAIVYHPGAHRSSCPIGGKQ